MASARTKRREEWGVGVSLLTGGRVWILPSDTFFTITSSHVTRGHTYK